MKRPAGVMEHAVEAVERIAQADHAFVERAGDDDDLEGRLRLRDIRDHPVRRASAEAAPGLLGLKLGSVAIARISPVRGRTTTPKC